MDYREEYAETLAINENKVTTMRYRELAAIESKDKFIRDLTDKSQGKLRYKDIETIVNHRWQLGSDEANLFEQQMTITIHDDAKSFAKAVTLEYTGLIHSWAGEKTFQQTGNWIIGDGEFGYYRDITHSNNGDIGSPEVESVTPDFDLAETQVVAVKSVTHNSYSRNSTFHEEDWKLHILSANSEYFIDADGEVYVMEIPEE